MRPTDIPDCLAIFARASSGSVSPAPWLLEKLLAEEAVSYQVYEGRDPGGGLHLLGFGGTGLVDPAALDTPAGSEDASIFEALWQAEERGHRMLLRPVEQGYANSAGRLHLAFLQFANANPGGSEPLGTHILDLSVRSLFTFRGGYSIERLFIELDRRDPRFDAFQRSVQMHGCRPLSASRGRFHHFELRREDLASCAFSFVRPLFRCVQPRYGFHRGERRMLQLAVLGWSDEEIASELGLALDTIHKRWRGIYIRVEDSGYPPWDGAAEYNKTARGPEKRRHLLTHLQYHPEELRPYAK